MDELQERYNKYYQVSKNNQIFLEDVLPNEEECRFILLKVVEQAVRDYTGLFRFKDMKSLENWNSAKEFLFDNDYCIDWGEEIIGLIEILEELDIDIKWFRMKTTKKFEELNGKEG
jgi:hypothetical protein